MHFQIRVIKRRINPASWSIIHPVPGMHYFGLSPTPFCFLSSMRMSSSRICFSTCSFLDVKTCRFSRRLAIRSSMVIWRLFWTVCAEPLASITGLQVPVCRRFSDHTYLCDFLVGLQPRTVERSSNGDHRYGTS